MVLIDDFSVLSYQVVIVVHSSKIHCGLLCQHLKYYEVIKVMECSFIRKCMQNEFRNCSVFLLTITYLKESLHFFSVFVVLYKVVVTINFQCSVVINCKMSDTNIL